MCSIPSKAVTESLQSQTFQWKQAKTVRKGDGGVFHFVVAVLFIQYTGFTSNEAISATDRSLGISYPLHHFPSTSTSHY